MKVIQVGAGFWGSGWADVVAGFPGTELAALVELDEMKLDEAGDRIGLAKERRYSSLDAALAEVDADAGLVVVPPEIHKDIAFKCMDAGLDCLVEKPLAPSLAEAAEVARHAKELDRRLMVTQSFRFKRGPQTVRKLIEEGAVGEIESVNVRFSKAPPFTGFRAEMEEPLIIDMSIHHFDFVRGILGLEPDRIRARSLNPSWSWFDGNAVAHVEMTTPDGANILYSGSWVSRSRETTWDGSWEIEGTEGSIVWAHNRVEFRPANFGLTVYRKDALEIGEGVMEVPLVELPAEEREGTLTEFLAAQEEGREPQANAEDNLRSLALVFGAVESTKTGDWVDLEVPGAVPA